jgi:predicted Rdx family selenoprotein
MNQQRVVISVHDHGMVLLDVVTGRVFSANRTGRMLWERLHDGASPAATAHELAAQFGIPTETAELHVERFVASLAAWQLHQLAGQA